jgi:muramoyltetrapeptide carboxypeptidase LdcA involved in peptidoglycan recycling
VDEELYRIDRFLFHVSSQPGFARLRQLRLGRCKLKANDRPFGAELEAVVRHWCERAGVPSRAVPTSATTALTGWYRFLPATQFGALS